ncbi:MAG: hypothetical protein ACUVUG_08430 [Candidatus Aminicenantia bacterium]
MEEKKEITQKREHRLDLRKFTKPEAFRAVEEKLASIGANDLLITVSSFDPDELKREVDFVFYKIWDYKKRKLEDGAFEATWSLRKDPPNRLVDQRLKYVE